MLCCAVLCCAVWRGHSAGQFARRSPPASQGKVQGPLLRFNYAKARPGRPPEATAAKTRARPNHDSHSRRPTPRGVREGLRHGTRQRPPARGPSPPQPSPCPVRPPEPPNPRVALESTWTTVYSRVRGPQPVEVEHGLPKEAAAQMGRTHPLLHDRAPSTGAGLPPRRPCTAFEGLAPSASAA